MYALHGLNVANYNFKLFSKSVKMQLKAEVQVTIINNDRVAYLLSCAVATEQNKDKTGGGNYHSTASVPHSSPPYDEMLKHYVTRLMCLNY